MQAALGLEHARLHGLVHRDIKPSNLFVASDGTVKVMDLGLWLWVDDAGGTMKARDIQVGTVDFMASEQAVDCRFVDNTVKICRLRWRTSSTRRWKNAPPTASRLRGLSRKLWSPGPNVRHRRIRWML